MEEQGWGRAYGDIAYIYIVKVIYMVLYVLEIYMLVYKEIGSVDLVYLPVRLLWCLYVYRIDLILDCILYLGECFWMQVRFFLSFLSCFMVVLRIEFRGDKFNFKNL